MKTVKERVLSNLLLILLLLVFVVLKWEYLSLPYFWDEAWVYGNAVHFFVENGIQILPSEDTLDLTRGHPMLFQFLFSAWGSIAGCNVFSLHMLALLIAIVLLVGIYYTFGTSYSYSVALWPVAFLISNEIFFVQSSLVLPEVLLSVFMLASIYSFIKEKQWSFILFFTLALYTKESAIVLIPLFLIVIFVRRFFRADAINVFKLIGWVFVPVGLAALHYIFQKWAFGWFFYPYHMDFIEFDLATVFGRLNAYMDEIFIKDYKFILLAVLLLVMGCRVMDQLKGWLLKLNLTVMSIAMIILGVYLFTGSALLIFNVLFLFSILLGLFSISYVNPKSSIINLTLWIFIIGYLSFCALNFFTIRYTIPVIVSFAFVLFGELYRVLPTKQWMNRSLVIPIFAFMWISGNMRHDLVDIDTSYKYAVKAHMEMTKYLEEYFDYNHPMIADFLERVNITNSRLGYLQHGQEFQNVFAYDDPSAKIKIISNLSGSIDSKKANMDMTSWEILKHIQNKRCTVLIYERISME